MPCEASGQPCLVPARLTYLHLCHTDRHVRWCYTGIGNVALFPCKTRRGGGSVFATEHNGGLAGQAFRTKASTAGGAPCDFLRPGAAPPDQRVQDALKAQLELSQGRRAPALPSNLVGLGSLEAQELQVGVKSQEACLGAARCWCKRWPAQRGAQNGRDAPRAPSQSFKSTASPA